jgi:hypothetical protein
MQQEITGTAYRAVQAIESGRMLVVVTKRRQTKPYLDLDPQNSAISSPVTVSCWASSTGHSIFIFI